MFMWKMTLAYLFLGLGAGEATQKSSLRSSPKPTSTDTGATCWESHAQGKEVSALQIPSAKASFIGSSAVFFGLVQLTKLNQRIQETIFRLKGSPSSYFPLSNPRCSLSFETHRYLESFSLTPMSYFLTQLPLQLSSVTWVPPPDSVAAWVFALSMESFGNHKISGACMILIVQIPLRGWVTWGTSLHFCEL